MTQNNLGAVLQVLGERLDGADGLTSLRAAEEAYRAALTVWTAEHFPYYHALAQENMDQVLKLIAEREAKNEG